MTNSNMEDFVLFIETLKKAQTMDWLARGLSEALTPEEKALLIERLSV